MIGTRATAQDCVELENMSRLARYATPMVKDPVPHMTSLNTRTLLSHLRHAEKSALRRKLNAQNKVNDYLDVAATLSKLEILASVGSLYGAQEAARYVSANKLDAAVHQLTHVLDQLCGRSVEKQDQGADQSSLGERISNAIGLGGERTKSANGASSSALFGLYALVGLAVVFALTARTLTSWYFALKLKRHSCRISAVVSTNTDRFSGSIIVLSMRGLMLDVPKHSIDTIMGSLKLGDMCNIKVADLEIPIKFTRPPDKDGAQLGFKIMKDLSYPKLMTLLSTSTIAPDKIRKMRTQ